MKISQPFFRILLLISILLSLFIIKSFITLILTGLIIAYILKPVYKRINNLIKNSAASALISELLFFVILIGLAIFSVSSIYYQISTFSSSALSQIFNLSDYFEQLNDSSILIDFNDDLTSQIFNIFTTKAKDLALKTPSIFIDVLLLFFIIYYFIMNSEELYKIILQLTPSDSRDSFKRFFSKINDLIKELSFGYFLISVFVMLLSFIFFNIIQLKTALDYSILSGAFSLIPLIGNWVIPIFLSIYYFYSKNYIKLFLMLGFSFFLSYLIKMVRVITNKNKTIHPILFILGVIIGFYSFGILGFLIGPVLFGVLQLGFQEIFSRQKII